MVEFKAVAMYILGAVVALLLFTFLRDFGLTTQGLTEDQICRQSAEANADFRFEKLPNNIEVKCPTLFIKVDSAEQNVVFENLARSLASTWDEMLLGEKNIFDVQDQNFCVIRRVLEFKTANKYKGFFDYLVQNNPPSLQQSYFRYLTNVDMNQNKETISSNTNLKNSDIIDTSTPYVAVFVMSKKANIGKFTATGIGAATGVAGGTVLGTSIGFFLSGAGTPIGIVLLGGSAVTAAGTALGGTAGYILGSESSADWDSAMMLIPYTTESLNSLKCTKLPASPPKLK